MSKKYAFAAAITLAAVAGIWVLSAYLHRHATPVAEPETAQAPVPLPVVRTAVAADAGDAASARVSYLGEILSAHDGRVFAYRDGIVEKTLVDIGSRVKEGQVVARLLPAQFSPDLANMIAEKKSMLIKAQGMLASARVSAQGAEDVQSRTSDSTALQVAVTVAEQDAKVAKMGQSLASLDVEISLQEKRVANMSSVTEAGVGLESRKLELSASNLKTAVKNAYANLTRIFYGSYYSPAKAATDFGGKTFGERDSGTAYAFANLMPRLYADVRKIDSMSPREAAAVAQNALEATDAALRLLEATMTKSDYDETMLNADKQMLVEAKTGDMVGIQTILNMYGEQAAMLDKERAMASSDVDAEKLDLEKMRAERAVMEKELAMARAERDRMATEVGTMRAMALNDASKMTTEARKMLIDAQADVDAAKAGLAALESAGFTNEVRAPFAGKITRRYLSVGDRVGMNQPLFDLVHVAPGEKGGDLFVRFEIPESDLDAVSVGDAVTFYRTQSPLQSYAAKVARISGSVDRERRTVTVEAAVDPSVAGRLLVGAGVRVQRDAASASVKIPASAVAQDGSGSTYVLTVAAGELRRRAVTPSRTIGDDVFVLSGLEAGTHVVVNAQGYPEMGDGTKVAEESADAPPPAAQQDLVDPHADGHAH